MDWIDTNGLWGDVPPQSLQTDGHCRPLPRNPHQQLRKHTRCCSGEIPLTSVCLLNFLSWYLIFEGYIEPEPASCCYGPVESRRKDTISVHIEHENHLSLSQWLDQNLELVLSGSCRLQVSSHRFSLMSWFQQHGVTADRTFLLKSVRAPSSQKQTDISGGSKKPNGAFTYLLKNPCSTGSRWRTYAISATVSSTAAHSKLYV